MDERLHPNWRAFSTANFISKRFVHGSELQSNAERKTYSPNFTQDDKNGVDIQKFYEDITRDSKTNSQFTITSGCQSPPIKESNLLTFDRNKFFHFATTNNATELARFNYLANDINVCDEFGWSSLMMAACGGATDVVRMLLKLGADKNIRDKTGRTALDLAQIKGFTHIAYMLQTEFKDKTETADILPITPNEPFFCKTCNRVFSDTSRLQHSTSTVHQFNTSSNSHNKLNKYNISTKNRGLLLMVKQGWDRESGLGPTSSGRLYPIKTVIRKKRTGLGTDQESARVTHFGAFDLRAVEHNKLRILSKNKNHSRNDIRREKMREWKREKRLRNELS